MTIVRNWIVPQIEPRTGSTNPPLITTTSLPNGTAGSPYSFQMSAVGGVPPYTWSLSGAAPDTGNWLSINTSGALSGTPTTGEVETVRIQVTDSIGALTAPTAFSLTVTSLPPLQITTTSLPNANVGATYTGVSLAANGGAPPYTWTLTGASPNWGRVWGTEGSVIPGGNFGVSVIPQQVETETLVLTVTDSVGATKSGTFSLTVNPASVGTWFGANLPAPPLQFSTTSSPPSAANTNRGSYYTPGVGADASLTLQAALNAAAAATGTKGDVIVLQAGTTYPGPAGGFVLQSRAGSGWIYIISSQAPEIGGSGLPAAGTRITRANIPNMATLGSPSSGPILTRVFTNTVTFYRLVGIDMELVDGTTTFPAVVWFNNSPGDSTQAQHITFDRCYIAGRLNGGAVHGINLDGNYMELTESMVERVFQFGNSENHAIILGNSTGPYKIHNNWLDGNGETSFVGGTTIAQPAPAMPSDFTFTNNHCHKAHFAGTGSFTNGSNVWTVASVTAGEIVPTMDVFSSSGAVPGTGCLVQSQLSGTPRGVGTYQMSQNASSTTPGGSEVVGGQIWTNSKNAFELKVMQRALIDSNFFENAFGGQQPRSACTLTVRNQAGNGGPGNMTWYALLDVTVSNNVFTNCNNGGFNLLLQDTSGPGGAGTGDTAASYRMLVRNNIFLIARGLNTTNANSPLMIQSQLPVTGGSGGTGGDVVFDHNVWVGPNGMINLMALGGDVTNNMKLTTVVWSNNIWDANQYGMTKAGTPGYNWNTAVVPQIATPVFINNVTVNTAFSQPAGNFIPANVAAVGFTNYGSITAATGYSLTPSSTFHAKGVSGLGQPATSAGIPDNTDLGCNVAALPTS